MAYKRMKFNKILRELDSEEKARAWVWLAKFDGKEFVCPECGHETFYQHMKNPEVRECRGCHLQVRLRANTILQDSKTKMLIWLRALCFLTQGKRGIEHVGFRHLSCKLNLRWNPMAPHGECFKKFAKRSDSGTRTIEEETSRKRGEVQRVLSAVLRFSLGFLFRSFSALPESYQTPTKFWNIAKLYEMLILKLAVSLPR